MHPQKVNGERLHAHLNRSSYLRPGLLDRAARLAELNRAFRDWATLQGPWGQQVQLANLADGRISLFAASAAALTPLRYRREEVLAWFTRVSGEPCSQLSVAVRPSLPAGETSNRRAV